MADAPFPSDPPDEVQARWRVAPVFGLIGTLVLCAAAMMAHLSQEQLKPAAAVLWVLGFITQAIAFIMALGQRHIR
jgi:hypothetical protein